MDENYCPICWNIIDGDESSCSRCGYESQVFLGEPGGKELDAYNKHIDELRKEWISCIREIGVLVYKHSVKDDGTMDGTVDNYPVIDYGGSRDYGIHWSKDEFLHVPGLREYAIKYYIKKADGVRMEDSIKVDVPEAYGPIKLGLKLNKNNTMDVILSGVSDSNDNNLEKCRKSVVREILK